MLKSRTDHCVGYCFSGPFYLWWVAVVLSVLIIYAGQQISELFLVFQLFMLGSSFLSNS